MTRAGIALVVGVLLLAASIVGGWVLARPTLLEEVDRGSEWDAYRLVDDDVVVTEQLAGACDDADGVELDESDERVVITTDVDVPPPWTVCVASAQVMEHRVVLDEPLGDRPVVDGACMALGGADSDCTRERSRGRAP